MEVIPVIDVMGGQVVHARRGERQRYAALASSRVSGCEPLGVARAMLSWTRSPILYAADLDAITGGRWQVGVWRDLLGLPGLDELWLDAGLADACAAHALRAALPDPGRRLRLVFGSESLKAAAAEPLFASHGAQAGDLLSLDWRAGALLDGSGIARRPQSWPARVIVMSMERVGSDAGPDLGRWQALRARDPSGLACTWYGAGGIRDQADLAAAAAAGAAGWLVASALHDGRLGPGR